MKLFSQTSQNRATRYALSAQLANLSSIQPINSFSQMLSQNPSDNIQLCALIRFLVYGVKVESTLAKDGLRVPHSFSVAEVPGTDGF